MSASPSLEDFLLRTHHTFRYADTGGLGHVDSAVLPSLLETGRIELLEHRPWRCETVAFVISRLEMDYITAALWPGTVEIGTSVNELGRSSIVLSQAVFQAHRFIATAQIVMLYVDHGTYQPTSLPETARAELMP